MSAPDNILERVRRLLALAESSNVHEAAAAAAKAQELMTKHRIEQAELEGEELVEDEPVLNEEAESFIGRKPWRELLLSGLAQANGCETYIVKQRRTGRITLRVLGPASDAGLVRYMQAYLTREVERLSDVAAKAERERRRRDGGDTFGVRLAWHNSFKLGAAAELRQRLLEASTRAMNGASGTALARIDKTDERVAAALAALNLGNRKHRARYRHSDAFRAGREAGAGINLDQSATALPAGASGALRSGT